MTELRFAKYEGTGNEFQVFFDTGGLFLQHAPTLYRYTSLEHLLTAEESGGEWPELPGPGSAPPTERP